MARILVVEDNRDHRKFIRDLLRLEGHDVVEASNGTQALKILESEKVSLVTLDQDMPGMSGLDCYEKMSKDIPVIFITVFSHRPEFDVLKRQGIPVIAKPFDYRDILSSVQKALKKDN